MKRSSLNVVLALGYLAVSIAVLVARAQPATNYEASIYTATPTETWIALAVALAIAVGVTLVCRGTYQAAGIGLGGLSVTTIVSMPSIRNYRYAGMGDALSHLGWTRDVAGGEMVPYDLFYPALHSISTAFHHLGGISLERAILLSVVVLFVPFVVFVPLAVRDLTGNPVAVGYAAIVSWMVLPINNVATHLGAHTNSNALFLVPIVVFAIVAYLRRSAGVERLPFGLSPFSVILYLSAIGLLLVHPQHMISVVVLIGTISALQYLARRRSTASSTVTQPATYAHTMVLGTIVVAWTLSNERFRSALYGLAYGILTQDIGAGAEVGQRESSLTDIGGSLAELFALMFLDAALIGLVVGLFLLALWLGRTRLDPETRSLVSYLGLSLFPLTGLLVVYFVGTPTMAFRQIGFIYVVLTILAGVALAQGVGGLSRLITTPGANAVAAAFLAVCLVLGLMTVFASPIIYSPTQHVTDQQMSGYETSLHHADERPIVGMGYDPYRFDHAINGIEGEDSLSGGTVSSGVVDVDEFEAGNYGGAYHGLAYYFVVTEHDVVRELEVYQELRHGSTALNGVESDSNVNKVVSNEEFRMYTVSSPE